MSVLVNISANLAEISENSAAIVCRLSVLLNKLCSSVLSTSVCALEAK